MQIVKTAKEIFSIYEVSSKSSKDGLGICCTVVIVPPITPDPKAIGHDILYGFGATQKEASDDAVEEATSYIKSNLTNDHGN